MQTRGDYYNGKRSERHLVKLEISDDRIQVTGNGIDLSWPVKEVSISAPLGSMKRSLYLPDGGKCDFDDNEFARFAEQHQGKGGFFKGVHRWENNLKLAFAALIITITFVLGFIQFGIPALSEQAAYAIPPSTEISLGQETLMFLDRAVFKPTGLDKKRQAEIEQMFTHVVAALDANERPYKLELRSSPKIGANAFALPGGSVIMTDELVEMAENDEEIAAVLAHEVGHVRHRHAMRQVIQGSAVGLIIATLTGDVFSATSMAAALPTMLVDAKFSRDMELQADDVAIEYLLQNGETVDHFATILTRMEKAFAEKHGIEAEEVSRSNYFSTHPATKERITRLKRQKD